MKSIVKLMLVAAFILIGCVVSVMAQPSGGGQGGGQGGPGGGGQGGPGGGQGGPSSQRPAEREEQVDMSMFRSESARELSEAVAAQRDSIERIYQGVATSVADPNKLYRVTGVEIYGAELLDPMLLVATMGINIGDSITIPSTFISNVVEKLWSQRNYSDIDVGAVITGDDVVLEFIFKEQLRVLNWDVEGLSKSKRTDLLDRLKFRRNSEYSEYVIDKTVKTIKNYYAESGFRNTEVEVRVENDPYVDNMVNVTFVVDRKNKVRIGEISFEGNEVFTDKKLRSTFKQTHQKSWNIFNSRKLEEDKFADDKELLIDFYNSKGYRNATILGDSIYDIDEKHIGIVIRVSEGNQYFIRNVEWVGNSKYETEQLQRMFGVRRDDIYDKTTMYKRLGIGSASSPYDQSILSLYQNDGYLMSQISLAEVIIGADSIDLEVKVFEGRPFTINEVNISGNMRVDDEIIRREIYTRPGELYNRSLLVQTMQMLGNMGHFNAEAIYPDIQPVSNSLVDIGWALEEQASDQFSISGGWGSNSFVGTVGVTLNNLSVREIFNGAKWKPYPMGQNQRLSIQAQTNGTYYQAYSLSFSDPWLGGRKPNSFTTSIYYSGSSGDDSYYYYDDSYYYEETDEYFSTFGVAVGLGKRLSWPDPYFSLYTELSYERYRMENWSSFIITDGHANKLSLGVTISRNSVDQQIYPRRGSNFSASLEVTPPYSLFNGKDYSDTDMSDQDRYRFIEFHKWKFQGAWYQSFMKNSNLVLKLGAEMGFLGSYNSDCISPFERFNVGGDGLSGYSIYGVDVVALRGYESGALDPQTMTYSLGYNKFTMELRYPIIMEASTQIYALAFIEGGNGFDSWRSFSAFNLKRSAGFGVRFYLPIVGMMGVDWGFGFDAATGETSRSGSQFHFVMGQSF